MDVVPSDFAAGLVLLRKQQKRQEHLALIRAIEEQQVLDSQVCYHSSQNSEHFPGLLIIDYHDEVLTAEYLEK